MSTPNIEELRRLAQAATPGIWCHVQRGISRWHGERIEVDLNPICDFAMLQDCCVHEYDRAYENAAYIQAANPAAIVGLIDTIQAQAERIAELETEVLSWKICNDRTADAARDLSAQLAEIAATEPVLVVEKEPDYWSGGHFHEGSKSHIGSTKVWRLPIGTKLFTRPMPAQDVTELVEALENLARLGNGEHYGNSDGNMIARTALSKYKGAK